MPEYLSKAEFDRLKKASIGAIVPKDDISRDLQRIGFLCLHVAGYTSTYSEPKYDGYVISPEGRRFLVMDHARRMDAIWTRTLATLAILISLAALALEFQDRGWFPFPPPTSATAATESPQPQSAATAPPK